MPDDTYPVLLALQKLDKSDLAPRDRQLVETLLVLMTLRDSGNTPRPLPSFCNETNTLILLLQIAQNPSEEVKFKIENLKFSLKQPAVLATDRLSAAWAPEIRKVRFLQNLAVVMLRNRFKARGLKI